MTHNCVLEEMLDGCITSSACQHQFSGFNIKQLSFQSLGRLDLTKLSTVCIQVEINM